MLLACCDALIAAQTAVIAAESVGVGSCYIGDILEKYEFHRESFNLPDFALPIGLICFGYPTAEAASARADHPLRSTLRRLRELLSTPQRRRLRRDVSHATGAIVEPQDQTRRHRELRAGDVLSEVCGRLFDRNEPLGPRHAEHMAGNFPSQS